jgi:hypothetical protein
VPEPRRAADPITAGMTRSTATGEGLLLPRNSVVTFNHGEDGWIAAPASVTAVNKRVEDQIAEVNRRLDQIERAILVLIQGEVARESGMMSPTNPI